MHLPKVFALSLAAVSLVSATCSQPAHSVKPTKSSARAHSTSTAAVPAEEEAVRAQLDKLRDAVAKGDPKAMTALWTEDGRYIDDEGQEAVGRAGLEKTFTDAVQENGKPQVSLAPQSVRFPARNVALVEGTVKRLVPGNGDGVPVSRYTLTLVKNNGEWLISSGTETPIIAATDAPIISQAPAMPQGNPLSDLSWLVGEWEAKRNGNSVHMTAEWVPSKNFIYCRYDIERANNPHEVESQLIGWDPRAKTPISWSFDSSGGFGQGSWKRQADKWVVQSSGVQRDGSASSATNIITANEPNSFSWQSVERRSDGVEMADTLPLKIERVRK
jgi:uncharacterized protein (TIGR02246 family)